MYCLHKKLQENQTARQDRIEDVTRDIVWRVDGKVSLIKYGRA